MGGKNDTDFFGFIDLFEQGDDCSLIFNINTGGGLIAEEDFWRKSQGPGQCYALGFTAGQGGGRGVFIGGHVH